MDTSNYMTLKWVVNPDTDAGRKIRHLMNTLLGPWAHTVHVEEMARVTQEALIADGFIVTDESLPAPVVAYVPSLKANPDTGYCWTFLLHRNLSIVSEERVSQYVYLYLGERDFRKLTDSGERGCVVLTPHIVNVGKDEKLAAIFSVIQHLDAISKSTNSFEADAVHEAGRLQCEKLVKSVTGDDWNVDGWHLSVEAQQDCPLKLHLLNLWVTRKYVTTSGRHYEKQVLGLSMTL